LWAKIQHFFGKTTIQDKLIKKITIFASKMYKSYIYMKRMMVAMAVVVMSFTAVQAQIPQSQLKTDSDEQLLREWIKVLASDEFG
jgi:hypothetical protein